MARGSVPVANRSEDRLMGKIRIASLQLKVYEDKYENIERLAELIAGGAAEGADIISLPEMWNCPYETENFPVYAEPERGDSWLAMSTLARKNRMYIVGGSVPELGDDGKIYNTCYVFDRSGKQIGKHRKVHLFDVYVHGQQTFKESDTLTGGDSFDCFMTVWCRMAVNICFDIRFPESSRIPALTGAKVIFNPASFNMTTGPAHWETAVRQRAIENQLYMVGTAAANDPDASYAAYGHSIITDPWGRVLMQMGKEPECNVTEIDLDYVDEVRRKLPLLSARRTDIYNLTKLQ